MSRPAVFVVHLARHRERRRRLGAALKKHGFEQVVWINAVDGQQLAPCPPWEIGDLPPVRPWQHWVDPYARRAMTLGEVACTLSHVLAWEHVARSDRPAIVLEDDAEPVSPLIDDLPMLLDDLGYLDFHLCYLAQRNSPGPKPLAGRYIHLVEDYHPVWTLAYFLTAPGARRLLASPWQEALVPSDELMPAVFGLNRESEVNKVFYRAPGLVVASNQRFFTPAEGSALSETEKSPAIESPDCPLRAFTVATEQRPELQRLLDSGRRYGLPIETLGLGETWRGGEMAKGPGGGQKVNLLRPALRKLPPEQPVLFIDGYDGIISDHVLDILRAWHRVCTGEQPLFAAEVYCWPDQGKADAYPEAQTRYRFLNSGAFIGQAGALLKILGKSLANHDDDQAYYTRRFLSGRCGMFLDTECALFQCLNGALEDVEVDEGRGQLYNRQTRSWPAVIHANGPSKAWLDTDGRAVGGRWRRYYGAMEENRESVRPGDSGQRPTSSG